ncbi:hypothetical protein, partial [Salmonella sp. NW644]|uniref:hypothetical protein n=1 Tax=Salmonella sp. NW644 TaxID=2948166 RepID=UPI003F423C52
HSRRENLAHRNLQPKSSWVDAAAPATGLFAVGSRVFLFNSVEITEINYPPTFTTNCQLPNHLRPFCEAAAGQVSGKQTNLVSFYRSTWWPCVKKDIVCALFYSCQFSPLGTLQYERYFCCAILFTCGQGR